MTYHPKWMLKNVYDTDEDNVIDWKALQLAGVRQEVLQNFTDPKILIATSSMNEVLNSADLVEVQAGNISSDSQELTIVGGTSSTKGHSWVYWNLPVDASKVYIKARLNNVNVSVITIELCNGDASTFSNPPNFYSLQLYPSGSTNDYALKKVVNDVWSTLGYEAVDLNYNTYYKIEFYWDNSGTLKGWRDDSLKINVNNTAISPIRAVRFRVYDNSTSEAQSGKLKGEVIIIYE